MFAQLYFGFQRCFVLHPWKAFITPRTTLWMLAKQRHCNAKTELLGTLRSSPYMIKSTGFADKKLSSVLDLSHQHQLVVRIRFSFYFELQRIIFFLDSGRHLSLSVYSAIPAMSLRAISVFSVGVYILFKHGLIGDMHPWNPEWFWCILELFSNRPFFFLDLVVVSHAPPCRNP